jgi:hypothetical protein
MASEIASVIASLHGPLSPSIAIPEPDLIQSQSQPCHHGENPDYVRTIVCLCIGRIALARSIPSQRMALSPPPDAHHRVGWSGVQVIKRFMCVCVCVIRDVRRDRMMVTTVVRRVIHGVCGGGKAFHQHIALLVSFNHLHRSDCCSCSDLFDHPKLTNSNFDRC